MIWYDSQSLQEEVKLLPPNLASIASRLMDIGKEKSDDRCECVGRTCVSGAYHWALLEVLGWPARRIYLGRGIERMKYLLSGHCNPYGLLYHSIETEKRIKKACQEIIVLLEEEKSKLEDEKKGK